MGGMPLWQACLSNGGGRGLRRAGGDPPLRSSRARLHAAFIASSAQCVFDGPFSSMTLQKGKGMAFACSGSGLRPEFGLCAGRGGYFCGKYTGNILTATPSQKGPSRAQILRPPKAWVMVAEAPEGRVMVAEATKIA